MGKKGCLTFVFILSLIVVCVESDKTENKFFEPFGGQRESQIPSATTARSRRDLSADNECSICNSYQANRCTVYEEAKAGSPEKTVTIKCFDGNIFITEKIITKPNTTPAENIQRIYSRTLKKRMTADQTRTSYQTQQRQVSSAYNDGSSQNNMCSVCTLAGGKDWSSQNDVASSALFDGTYLPDDSCSVCEQTQANTCSVNEETASDIRNIEVKVKCLIGDSVVTERTLSKPNPYPNQRFRRYYSKSFRSYSSRQTTTSSRNPTDNTYTSSSPDKYTWTNGGKKSADVSCSICEGTRANTCAVNEETSYDLQNLLTTVKCQEGDTILLERTFTKPNPFPNNKVKTFYTQTFSSSIVTTGSAVPLEREVNQHSYREVSDTYNRKNVPGNTYYIPVTTNKDNTEMRNVLDKLIDKSKSTNPNSEIDLGQNFCGICEGTQANSCSVKEKTSSDYRHLLTTVKCFKGEHVVHEKTYTNVNPYPNNQVERWYTQSVRETTHVIPLTREVNVNSQSEYSKIYTSGDRPQINSQHQIYSQTKETPSANLPSSLEENPLNTYCNLCESVSQANKCSVREESSPDTRNLMVIVKCLDGDNLLYDKSYSKVNPYPNKKVARWYSQSVKTTTTVLPATNTETFNRYSQTSSTNNYEYISTLDNICSVCQGTPATTCSVGEETTSSDTTYLTVTVKCLNGQYLVTEKLYRTPNPHPNKAVSRWYSESVRKSSSNRYVPNANEISVNSLDNGYSTHSVSHTKETSTNQRVVNSGNKNTQSNYHYTTLSEYEKSLLAQSCVICDGTQAKTCTVDEETSIDLQNLITLVKCLDGDAVVTERTYYKPNPTPNKQMKRWFSKTVSRTMSVIPVNEESSSYNDREYSTRNSHTSSSQYQTKLSQTRDRQNFENFHNTNQDLQMSSSGQHDTLVYGENHMPDKPCSICDKTEANTCSVKEETSSDTKNLVTTIKCLSGSSLVMEREFVKPNPYPGSRIRRTHYESCGTNKHSDNDDAQRTLESY